MPEGRQSLAGRRRTRPGGARRAREVDPGKQVTIRIILRRRTDTPADSSIEAFLTAAPMQRQGLSVEEHAQRFGAAASDLDGVQEFLGSGGLTIDEAHAASRTVIATGTARRS
jgi:kumamolisin